jgi:predicted phage terminase large subunit-like protein
MRMPSVPIDLAEIEAEQERRYKGQELHEEAAELERSLRKFIRAAWHVIEPATVYSHNWHIDAIAEHLEAAYAREIRRLLINIPPRCMKSRTVSVFGPAWRWTHAPHERFLTASYGADLATEHAKDTRRLIQSGWYRARWGHSYQLTTDQNVKTWYENDRTGYRIATSVGGSGTGRGGDVIVIDDPLNADDALSDVKRTAANAWHDGTIATRFNDPKTGVEIIVMQRLHELDLAGHVLEQAPDRWTHLCLPAEYEPKHPFVWPDDPRSTPGELLWPEHNPPEEHEATKETLGSYNAAGQLQQRPAPAEGGIFKTAWWRYYNPANIEAWTLPPVMALITSWDTALKDKTTSDYCVGSVWAAIGANRYLLRLVRERMDLPTTKRAVRELAAWVASRFPNLPHSIVVENAANGPDVVAQLRNEVQGLILNRAEGDKVQRAHAVTPQIESGNVFLPGFALPDGSGPDPARTPAWVQDFISELSAFDNAANDDQVDSCTQALLRMKGNYAPRTRREEDTDPGGFTEGVDRYEF